MNLCNVNRTSGCLICNREHSKERPGFSMMAESRTGKGMYPIIAFHSSYGHIPNLASDLMIMHMFNSGGDQSLLLHVDIGDLIQKSFGDISITTLVNRSSMNNKLLYSPRHMNLKESFATSKGVAIDGPGGRRHMSNLDYAKRISIDKPSFVISMADHVKIPNTTNTALNSNDVKKARVAIERTNKWFDELKSYADIDWNDTKLFGVALAIPIIEKGSDGDKTCRYDIVEPVKRLLDNSVDGIVIGGSFIEESLSDLVEMIKEAKKAIFTHNKSGKQIPVMVQGARTLHDMVECVSAGADILSTSYPSDLSRDGLALVLTSVLASRKRKLDDVEPPNSTSNVIDLNDSKYCEDVLPLVPDCECHCCSNHTRAYVHHLLRAKEMLAGSLLQSHNHHQVLLLFHRLRENRDDDESAKEKNGAILV